MRLRSIGAAEAKLRATATHAGQTAAAQVATAPKAVPDSLLDHTVFL